jgi:hypothetical protein
MKPNRTTLRDRCRMAMAGIDKHLASETTIPLDGAAKAPADIKKALQGTIDAADATQAARANWLDASRAERSQGDGIVSLLASLRAFVILKFGGADVATLADFGFTPRKQTPKTVETKAVAVEKSLATRKARHTMGSRQKEKIKGTIPEPVTGTGTAAGNPPAPSAPVASPPAGVSPTPRPATGSSGGT